MNFSSDMVDGFLENQKYIYLNGKHNTYCVINFMHV